jgi:hypothetical protein
VLQPESNREAGTAVGADLRRSLLAQGCWLARAMPLEARGAGYAKARLPADPGANAVPLHKFRYRSGSEPVTRSARSGPTASAV